MSLTTGIEVEILNDDLVEIDRNVPGVDVEILLVADTVDSIQLKTDVVEILAGIQGATGPPGPAGDSGNLSFSIDIVVASTDWSGAHTLGFKPAGITIQDQTGKFRYGFEIVTLDETNYHVRFGAAMIGKITLS